MFKWMFLLGVALGGVSSSAQAHVVDKVVVFERGIYSAEIIDKIKLPSAVALDRLHKIKLLRSTTTVPGRMGIRFGFRYIIRGQPRGASVDLTMVVRFPSDVVNLDAGLHQSRSQYAIQAAIGRASYRSFHFDDEREIIPGLWVFEIWYQDRKLGEQRFCVQESAASDNEASIRNPVESCDLLMAYVER